MFILHPDPYLLPCYRISPFTTGDNAFNHSLADDDIIDDYFTGRFGKEKFLYTYNGREAINIALNHYNLNKSDVVSIFTTSSNFYISSCVTKEIEKFCNWSRQIESNTKLILVNHEFGYPYTTLPELAAYNLPIIENCAHSFFSQDKDKMTGKTGDFVIYSLPKMFPVQIGGLLVSNIPVEKQKNPVLDHQSVQYIKNVLSYYINRKDSIIKRRLNNYLFLREKFSAIGLFERFPLTEGIVPGVFMFRKGNHKIDLPQLKVHFYEHGIQCSVFYGEEAFFIPVHQALNEFDLLYFHEVMSSFLV